MGTAHMNLDLRIDGAGWSGVMPHVPGKPIYSKLYLLGGFRPTCSKSSGGDQREPEGSLEGMVCLWVAFGGLDWFGDMKPLSLFG